MVSIPSIAKIEPVVVRKPHNIVPDTHGRVGSFHATFIRCADLRKVVGASMADLFASVACVLEFIKCEYLLNLCFTSLGQRGYGELK